MKIELLKREAYFSRGKLLSRPPNDEEIMEKINEIITYINLLQAN